MKRVAAALALVLVIAGVAFVFVRRADEAAAPVGGLRALGDEPFGGGSQLGVVAERAVLGADGTRLAVITDDGLSVAERGGLRAVTQRGSHVVDVAWFGNGATLLVAEGPIPTGGLAVVDLDGKVRGTVPLTPSVGFGTGHGMVVLPGGKRAVVTAVDRPALGPEQRRLVLVDLTTGATSDLTAPGGADEEGPVVLDEHFVAFTSIADGTEQVALVDVATGAARTVVPGRAVGAAPGTIVAATTDELVAVRPGKADATTRTLVRIPAGQQAVGADPTAGEAVALDRGGHVHRIRFDPVPITP